MFTFKHFSIGRDADGNLVVDFKPAIAIQVIGMALAPFAGALGFAFGGPPGLPWWVVFIALLAIPAFMVPLLLRNQASSRATVTFDRAKSRVLINDKDGAREVAFGDIDRLEFGTVAVQGEGNQPVSAHRLEIVKRSGERVPGTGCFHLAAGDREAILAQMKQALTVGAAMVS